ncbi:YdcF family protein [Vibrio sp. TBV020]|uniref:YdcF family protein n=1 Tax=Vibrio sp. TBV020 TaxID=3137398 RepID=UPI0038CDAAB6
MANKKLYQHIEHIWDYMQLDHPLKKADCIFVLGSNDLRVAEYAATLYLEGWAEMLIFSGGVGRLTKDTFESSEAETFAAIAKGMGVPHDAIIIEPEATNTGQNVQFTHQLLKQKNIEVNSFILVQKPYMERRTLATFEKQWPSPYESVSVTSPKTRFCDYFNDEIDIVTTVTAMLGDFERIKNYPALGFQSEQEIPQSVEHSYQTLKPYFE